MKCLCMIFYDEKRLEGLSGQEFDALNDESLAYYGVLRPSRPRVSVVSECVLSRS